MPEETVVIFDLALWAWVRTTKQGCFHGSQKTKCGLDPVAKLAYPFGGEAHECVLFPLFTNQGVHQSPSPPPPTSTTED